MDPRRETDDRRGDTYYRGAESSSSRSELVAVGAAAVALALACGQVAGCDSLASELGELVLIDERFDIPS